MWFRSQWEIINSEIFSTNQENNNPALCWHYSFIHFHQQFWVPKFMKTKWMILFAIRFSINTKCDNEHAIMKTTKAEIAVTIKLDSFLPTFFFGIWEKSLVHKFGCNNPIFLFRKNWRLTGFRDFLQRIYYGYITQFLSYM